MIKKFCDICQREIKDYEDETYTISIVQNEEKYNAKEYTDVCKNCALDLIDIIFKMSKGEI